MIAVTLRGVATWAGWIAVLAWAIWFCTRDKEE